MLRLPQTLPPQSTLRVEYLDKMSLTVAHLLHSVNVPVSAAFEGVGIPDAIDRVRGRLA